MTDWLALVRAYHDMVEPDDPDALVFGEPASANALDELDRELGFTMPKEFRDLYSTFDGFGSKSEDEGTTWFLLPLAKIPVFTIETRDWFQETHSKVAAHYVAIFDWYSGDASGFLFRENGKARKSIFMFEHERYLHGEAQHWLEFLMPVDASLASFFKPSILI